MLRHGRQAHREGCGDLLRRQVALSRQAAQGWPAESGRQARQTK
jgi:hypothetical protein